MGSTSVKASLRHASDPFYNRRFVKRLAKVTVADVQRLAMKYLPLFQEADLTRTAVVCGTSQVKGVAESLKQYGLDLTIIDDIDNSILTQ